MFIDRYNNDLVRVAPCCQAIPGREPTDGFDFATSPTLNRLREQFSLGQKPAACQACWKAESVGHKSRRQSAIEFFNLKRDHDLVQLESIDYSATWACNMACVMCGPHSSSLWATQMGYDQQALAGIGRRFQQDNHLLDGIDMSHVKKIHFNGGEPLLNDHQTTLLDMLEQKEALKDAFISYNTNGSVFPSKQLINRWQRSRLVKLFFSIDATDRAFEYIRWPGRWSAVSQNIARMRDTLPSNVMFGLNVTVGVYNILEMQDLCAWFDHNISTNREGDASDFNWQLAMNFDPAQAPKAAKMQAIDSMLLIPQLHGLVNYLTRSIDNSTKSDWITTFENLDRKRNTNWRTSLKISSYH